MNIKEIKELLRAQKWEEARSRITALRVPEIADLLLELKKKDSIIAFRLLPKNISAEVFSYLEWERQHILLKDLTLDETKHILTHLKPDDRTDFLEELPGKVSQRLLNLLPKEELDEARKLLGYPEDSAGRLMTPDYVAVRPEWTIEKVIKHIREKGQDSETVAMIYVTDKNWKLLDALKLSDIMLADPDDTVNGIMDYSFVKISATADREDAVKTLQKYDLYAVPVVDSEVTLLGIITYDDIIDIAEEEATEDFHKNAAVLPIKGTYKDMSVWHLYNRRILWLVLLVILNIISAGIIEKYEMYLANLVALAFFIPLLIGCGGNSGAQSATLMVRAISTDDVKLNEWFKVVLKEISVGVSLGIMLGVITSILGIFMGGLTMGIIIAISMVLIIVISNLIGAMLPFVFTLFKFDPAVASGPLITTISDIVGLFIYFYIASIFIVL